MSERPGFFERQARKEYEQPAWTLVPLGGVALLSLLLGDYWFALIFGAIIPIRIWGMRPGGYLRRAYQRKYGWD